MKKKETRTVRVSIKIPVELEKTGEFSYDTDDVTTAIAEKLYKAIKKAEGE